MKKLTSFLWLIGIFCHLSAQNLQFEWAKSVGGIGEEYFVSTVVDDWGNVFSAGGFEVSGDFDPNSGIATLNTSCVNGLFLTKLDANDNFVWAKTFEGHSIANFENCYMYCQSMKADKQGNLYLLLNFQGEFDFDPGVGTFMLSNVPYSGLDGIVVKLDNNGVFVWAKPFVSTGGVHPICMAIDKQGNLILGGTFHHLVDFDPSAASYDILRTYVNGVSSNNDRGEGFIAKLDQNGDFVWAKNFPANMADNDGNYFSLVLDIDIDNWDNIYSSGVFTGSIDFDPNSNTSNLMNDSTFGYFVVKMDASGGLTWAKNMGSTQTLPPQLPRCSIALDKVGNVFFTGKFAGTVDFNPGISVYNMTAKGAEDMSIVKLTKNGAFIWAKQVGGTSANDMCEGSVMKRDVIGNIYIEGGFQGDIDFDPNVGAFTLTSNTPAIFILKLDDAGGFTWAGKLDGKYVGSTSSLQIDSTYHLYIAGTFENSGDFDPTSTNYTLNAVGSLDAFIVKMSQTFSPSSIEPNTDTPSLLLYPNPANDAVFMQLPESAYPLQVLVYDNLGRVVLAQILSFATPLTTTPLTKGLYKIQVLTQDAKGFSGTFIKE